MNGLAFISGRWWCQDVEDNAKEDEEEVEAMVVEVESGGRLCWTGLVWRCSKRAIGLFRSSLRTSASMLLGEWPMSMLALVAISLCLYLCRRDPILQHAKALRLTLTRLIMLLGIINLISFLGLAFLLYHKAMAMETKMSSSNKKTNFST